MNVSAEFPRVLYHRASGQPKLVQDAAEEAALGGKWSREPIPEAPAEAPKPADPVAQLSARVDALEAKVAELSAETKKSRAPKANPEKAK